MKFIAPTMEYDDAIQAFRKEYLADGGSMDGSTHLRKSDNTREWLNQLEPDTSTFIYLKEDCTMVGIIEIRHIFNKYLELYGGHIGYCVRPSERKKGYASQMLALALKECSRLKIKDVLITCLKDNEASRRTIVKNGGIFESTVFEPESEIYIDRYWIHL